MYIDGEVLDNLECDLSGTPCETIIGKSPRTFTRGVQKLFPGSPTLAGLDVEGYSGLPLFDSSGKGLGILVVMFKNPMEETPFIESALQIFAARASAEIERQHYEEELRKSEIRFRSLVETAPSVIIGLTPDYRITEFNPEAERTYGMKREEVLGRDYLELFVPEQARDAVRSDIAKVLAGHSTRGFENEVLQSNGEVCTFSWNVARVTARDGQTSGIIAVGQDITRRKKMEAALRESEEKYRRIFEDSPIGIFQFDDKGVVIAVNEQMIRIFQGSRETMVGLDLLKRLTDPRMKDAIQAALSGKQGGFEGDYVPVVSGIPVTVKVDVSPLFYDDGTLCGGITIVEDISDRKKAEKELKAERDRAQTYLDVAGVMLVALNVDGTVSLVNRKGCELLGYDEAEIIGRNWFDDFLPASIRDEVKEVFSQVMSGAEADMEYYENPVLTKSGEERLIAWNNTLLKDGHGHLIGTLSSGEDITEPRRAVLALRESETAYRALAGNLPGIVYRIYCRENNRMQFFNEMCSAMTGYSPEELGPGECCSIKSLILPEERSHVTHEIKSAIAGRRPFSLEYRIQHKDGNIRYFLEKGTPVYGTNGKLIYIDGLIYDMTENKRIEAELSRAQRLEAAAQVAGQIAHDFNNLLSPLMAYPDLIRMEMESGAKESVLPLVDQMQSVAIQMAEINQQLLTLARRAHYNPEVIHLNDLLEKILNAHPVSPRVSVMRSFEPGLFHVKGGTAQLNRVFTNLIQNALEAMNYMGCLTISTENVYLDRTLRGYVSVQKGEYACVKVEDTGCGIEPSSLDRIFEPFYTTKITDKKRGSGLGLSVVRAVVDDHQGYLGVETRPGSGTTFSVFLPITRESALIEKGSAVEFMKGDERILIVDDDPVQREVMQRLLVQLGYKSHAVESGETAVEYLRDHPQDLLILDMVMDGIDGAETFRQVKEVHPNQKAIILSGYAESHRVAEAQRMGAGEYIRKPIDLKVLSMAIRRELDRG